MKVSNDVADDDSPLLNVRAKDRSHRSDGTLSVAEAHRRRARALVQALWDSGVLCICTAAIVFAFAAFFVKLMGNRVPVFEIVLFRSVTSFLICVVSARASGITPFFGRRANLRLLMARGLFGAAAMTTYYFSIRYLPLADAVTLFFLNPAITAIAAWVIMHEPLRLRGVAGVLVSLGGLLLVTRPPFIFGETDTAASGGGSGDVVHTAAGGDSGLHTDAVVGAATAETQRLLGSMFGLLSAVLSAGAFICIRYIGKSEPALVMSVYFHSCAAVTSVIPLTIGVPRRAVVPTGLQWVLLLAVGNCSFWGQILISRGFQLLNAAKASAINLTQVVYSYLLGLLFLHESFTLLGAAGSALIGLGALLVNLKPKKEANPPVQSAVTAADAAALTSGTAAGGKREDPGTTGRDEAAPTIDNYRTHTTGSTAEPAGSAVVVEMAGNVGRSVGRHQDMQRLLCPAKLSDQGVDGDRGDGASGATGGNESGVGPGLEPLADQRGRLTDKAPRSVQGRCGVGCEEERGQGLSVLEVNVRQRLSDGAGRSGGGSTALSSTFGGRLGGGEEGFKPTAPPPLMFAASREAVKEGGSGSVDSGADALESVGSLAVLPAVLPAGHGTFGIRTYGTEGG